MTASGTRETARSKMPGPSWTSYRTSVTPHWIDCDYGWDWYYGSTDEELDSVREVLFNDDSSAYEYTPPAYPCWICCSNDSNGYGRIEGTVEQVFDALDELKKGVTDKMMENGRGFH